MTKQSIIRNQRDAVQLPPSIPNSTPNSSKRQQQNKSINFDIQQQQQLLLLDLLSQKVHDGLTELGDESPLKTTINEFLDVFNAVKPALHVLTHPQNQECTSMLTPKTTKIPQEQKAPSNKNNKKTYVEALSSKEKSGIIAPAKQQHQTTNSKNPSRLAANNNNIQQRSIVVYGLAESKEKLPSKRTRADITKTTKLLCLPSMNDLVGPCKSRQKPQESVLMEVVNVLLDGPGINVKIVMAESKRNCRLLTEMVQLPMGPITIVLRQDAFGLFKMRTKIPHLLRMDEFLTECCWDILYIYDGDGVYDNLIAVFSGSLAGKEIVAKSGQAIIHFSSDLAFNLPGFNISYHIDTCLMNCSENGICMNGVCNCNDGYTGERCEYQMCLPSMNDLVGPCKNQAVCNHGKCECTKHTHGDYCQELVLNPVWDTVFTHHRDIFQPRALHKTILIDNELWIYGGLTLNPTQMASDFVVYNLYSKKFRIVKAKSAIYPLPRYDHLLIEYKVCAQFFSFLIIIYN